jgi:threo-3-hydroxy-L-aspartate ammonia-lyase
MPEALSESVTFADVEDASTRVAGQAHRTPVATSRTLDARLSCRLFVKCENLQRAGAFKFRGAFNAMAQLDAGARSRGVLAFSSGNHAQAVALAGRELGIATTIIMPTDAPVVKQNATRGYGGDVVLYDRSLIRREALAAQLASERGLTVIPPYDHPHIVAGQGTAARELIEEAGPLDLLLVPCGGGGLLAGSAIAAAAMSPGCQVIGVEPAAADDATRSFRTGVLHTVHNPDTIADGARTPSLGAVTFPLIQRHVHDMVTVTDDMLIDTMRIVWERMKLIVEPTGALGAAAALHQVVAVRDRRVGVILSGGNVDLAQVGGWFRER